MLAGITAIILPNILISLRTPALNWGQVGQGVSLLVRILTLLVPIEYRGTTLLHRSTYGPHMQILL